MCYSISFLQQKAKKLAERYQGILPPHWKDQLVKGSGSETLTAYYFVSGFAHPNLPLLSDEGIRLASWGLIPHWARDRDAAMRIRKGTLNARGETVFEKPSFRQAVRRQRAILPVNGFFEWREHGGRKYPYFIYPRGDEYFSLGCLYDRWTDKETGEMILGFGIVTTAANPLMAQIHNRKERMPLILTPGGEKAWLDKEASREEVSQMIKACPEELMEAHPVSRSLNNARNDRNTASAMEAVHYAGLPPLS